MVAMYRETRTPGFHLRPISPVATLAIPAGGRLSCGHSRGDQPRSADRVVRPPSSEGPRPSRKSGEVPSIRPLRPVLHTFQYFDTLLISTPLTLLHLESRWWSPCMVTQKHYMTQSSGYVNEVLGLGRSHWWWATRDSRARGAVRHLCQHLGVPRGHPGDAGVEHPLHLLLHRCPGSGSPLRWISIAANRYRSQILSDHHQVVSRCNRLDDRPPHAVPFPAGRESEQPRPCGSHHHGVRSRPGIRGGIQRRAGQDPCVRARTGARSAPQDRGHRGRGRLGDRHPDDGGVLDRQHLRHPGVSRRRGTVAGRGARPVRRGGSTDRRGRHR